MEFYTERDINSENLNDLSMWIPNLPFKEELHSGKTQ